MSRELVREAYDIPIEVLDLVPVDKVVKGKQGTYVGALPGPKDQITAMVD